MGYLLDTNVVSELRRRSPAPPVVRWFATVRSDELFVSVLTLGEIRLGIDRLRRRDERAAQGLDEWLGGVASSYRDRIAGIDARVADRWGRLNAKQPLPVVDSLLAATALVHGWTLVTRNVTDVAATGVALLDPFA